MIIFRKIFLNPVFSGEFPGVVTLLTLSILFLISNFFYLVILDPYSNKTFYLIAELAFWSLSLVTLFGLLYFFSSEQSDAFLAGSFRYDKNIFKNFIKVSLAVSVIYILGVFWLGALIGWDKPILSLGIKPFLLAELFKVIIVTF